MFTKKNMADCLTTALRLLYICNGNDAKLNSILWITFKKLSMSYIQQDLTGQ